MNMVTFNGSHGTSDFRARRIEAQGFIPGKGRAGTGVYFWKQGRYSVDLAIGWYKYLCSRNFFAGELNPEAILC